MPGFVNPYSLQYPLDIEANNVPTQVQNLALGIDSALLGIDALANIADNRDRAAAFSSTPQATVTAIGTTLTFSTEEFDSNGIINLGVSNTNFVIPATASLVSLWVVTAHCNFAANAVGVRQLSVLQNGTSRAILRNTPDQTGAETSLTTCHMMACAPGDIITCAATQNSGGNLNVNFKRLTIWQASA